MLRLSVRVERDEAVVAVLARPVLLWWGKGRRPGWVGVSNQAAERGRGLARSVTIGGNDELRNSHRSGARRLPGVAPAVLSDAAWHQTRQIGLACVGSGRRRR